MTTTETALQVRNDVPLAPSTTLGVGGPARWFATAITEEHIQQAVQFVVEHDVPLFVLGGGSNVLVSDEGFPGLVLHIALRGITISASSRQGKMVLDAAAGEGWDNLVQFTVDRDLAGMECLAGIPGTVGGTPVQNVGAYGQDVSQTILKVRCFDRQSSHFVELDHAACGFAYRTSLLNTSERGRYIVTAVQFELEEHGGPNLSYADLQKRFAGESPTLRQTAEAVREIRRAKGMVVDAVDPDSRSAGSFFKNPVVDRSLVLRIAEAAGLEESTVPRWPALDEQVKLPAAWLLEHAGFPRGYTLGRAGISTKHTLALINRGDATARDIAALRERIRAGVLERFGVALEQEPINVS